MTILLAYPPFKEGARSGRWPGASDFKNLYFFYPPWFLAYATALLEENGIEVSLIDAVAEDLSNEEFLERVKKISPELLIVETSTSTFDKDMVLMRRIKEEVGCQIALSGPHVTALTQEVMTQNPFIDFVLTGEYELTALELAQKLKLERYYNILGLAFRKNKQIKINPRRPLIQDLDDLPFIARHFLPMDRYNEAFAKVPNQQMLTSRGCPFRCVFCLWPQTLFNRTTRFRRPEKVVDEMEFLWNEYKPREIYFDDDTFTLFPKHVLGVCEEIKKRKLDLEWCCMGHGDISKEVLMEMKSTGCTGVKFGVETASPEVMKKINKAIDLERVKNFVKTAKAIGIRTHATYMIGLPGDTKESIMQTFKFALDLKTDSFQLSIATPFPGTEFYEQAKKEGWLVTDDFSRFNGNKESVVSYPQLKKEEIDKLFKESINLTSKFDPSMIRYFMDREYKTGGLSGLSSFMIKESPLFLKRLVKKRTFFLRG